MSPLEEAAGKTASDLSGRSGQKDFHAVTVGRDPPGALAKSDIQDVAVPASPGVQNRRMQVAAPSEHRLASTASPLTVWSAREFDKEKPRVAIPHAQVQIVVRFGPVSRDGVDIHVLGAQQTVRRKFVRGVQRSLVARCSLECSVEVFGVFGHELAGRIAPLESLWGEEAALTLRERLASAADPAEAAVLLDAAVAERVDANDAGDYGGSLVAEAARRLPYASVRTVADGLGVSERHLRRLFGRVVGMSPKQFERIARFERALRSARTEPGATWTDIAAATGYYDQAHLIGDFRQISGRTPGDFLRELCDEV
jgi:AraC-like DNA-binding protein